jgi:GDP-mannose 6-dehydrogenase
MRISVFGLGYVGTVSAACLAADGHDVIAVDPAQSKVDAINRGQSPIIEEYVGEIVAANVQTGRLRAAPDAREAIQETELSLVCVGTPSQSNGSPDLRYIRRTCEQIGAELANKSTWHNVVVRSTVMPGTMRNVVIPTLETCSGKDAGIGFGVCHNPEFLREGTAVCDFRTPAKTVIGQLDRRSGESAARLYRGLMAPLIITSLESAEMVKYVDNGWHALKVGFANEIGNLCKALSVDCHEVMKIFCADRKLNISAAYLSPGFAFGGSCLPKDVRALAHQAKIHDLDLPIISAILPSNDLQIRRGLQLIMETGSHRIGILGCTFKAGTDDLRESPLIELIERLLGKGYDLKVYDPNVNLSCLVGANREFVLQRIPHISRLLVNSVDAILEHAQTIVLGNKNPDFDVVLDRLDCSQTIVDLADFNAKGLADGKYEGICW